MKAIEERMEGLEKGVKDLKDSMDHSFEKGEIRFEGIENKIDNIEIRMADIENRN